ncbi:MAG: hypothetical protein K8U57_03850, partial [Planctomycetes bacterium]|nr:hypothetical protein [Planctomycetota bacterium]
MSTVPELLRLPPRSEPLDGVLFGYPHNHRENRRAVLFVHGFRGTGEKTWQAGDGSMTFLELIATDPDLVDHDV